MSYFLANAEFVRKMILFVLIVFVFLQSRAIAMGKMDFLGELSGGSGREELVKWAGYGEEKLSTVVIGGRLLCNGGGANPVSGATMAVVCGSNGRKKVSWVGKGSTDSSGEFLIDVPSHLHAIPNLENTCHVKVVRIPTSSPCRKSCTRNINNKKPIKPDSSIGEGIRSYTTHNIHLTMHASS